MPLKREPDAVSALPLNSGEGETVVSKGCQLGSKPRPDHTAPRCSRGHHCYRLPPPPAPCLRAATSPCASRVRRRGWGWSASTSPSPDHTTPRCSRHHHCYQILPPPPPCPRAATS